MSAPSHRSFRRIALLTICLLTLLLQPVVHAQDAAPTTPTPQPQRAPQSYVAQPQNERSAPAKPSTRVDRSDAPDAAATELAKASDPQLLDPTTSLAGPISANGAQGIVQLDVTTATSVRAGDLLDYTFIYTNTTASTQSGLIVDGIWTNFSAVLNGDIQSCNGTCTLSNVQGPTPTQAAAPAGSGANLRFTVGSLSGNQSGRFTVSVRIRSDVFPKSNQPQTVPAGSGRLFLNNATGTVVSEDTANSLVVGPVFALSKVPATSNKIYPGEQAEYILRIGNATGPGNNPGGQVRADARPATNIVIVDPFPAGSEYVSSSPTGTANTTAKTLTWTLAGPLNPGETIELRVTFKKLDVTGDCERMRNGGWTVTSNEMPLNNSTRSTVGGPDADVPLVLPLAIKSISVAPYERYFGSDITMTFTVQNFWNQPINGAQLQYDIQSNAAYIPNTTSPAASTVPSGNPPGPGGRVVWTFTMPAGSKTAATEASFSIHIRAGYTTDITGNSGLIKIIPPAGVPAACILAQTTEARAGVSERLYLTKGTPTDPSTAVDGNYIVVRNQEFPYYIDITNKGGTDATGIDVTDQLPAANGADFSYVVGSGKVGTQTREPDSYFNGQGGSMIWNNLSVPAGQTLRISYRLIVRGADYVQYCNLARMTAGSEPVRNSYNSVCVKINPNIRVTKTANKTTANPDDQVQFTLTLTNNESTTYRVALYDDLGAFTFVQQDSISPASAGQPQLDPQQPNSLTWPLVDLGPGQTITSVITARVPSACVTQTYNNNGLFHNDQYRVYPQPAVIASVRVNCGQIEYSASANRSPISLRDRVQYTLQIRNADANPASNINVDNLLPLGFTYVGLDATTDIKTVPTQSTDATTGRPKQTWTIPSIAGNTTVNIRFVARSGDVVGTDVRDDVIAAPNARCVGNCETIASANYAFTGVNVSPLITMEPTITPATCALPGAKPVYRLTILNTNNHDYTNTSVNVTLPFGLSYVRPLPSTPTPTVSTNALGVTTVSWSNLRVSASSGGIGTQVVLEIELVVGQVWGDLATVVDTTSPDGLIPRKEGVQNPTVPVCPSKPSIAKEANRRTARVGDDILYQITLANTNPSMLTVSVRDQLPSGITYLANTAGPAPTVSGNMLTWTNVVIPAAANGKAGIAVLQFRTRLTSGQPGRNYTNTGVIASSPVAFDTTYASVTINIPGFVYLPMIRRQ